MRIRMIHLAGVLLFLAACSSTPEPEPGAGGPQSLNPAGGGGSFAPGSQQDLAATAGDRVFFAFDRSDISSEAQQILARQADWLKRYPSVSVTDRGSLRRTRDARIQSRARRAPRPGGQERARRQRHPGGADRDDQLRQGAPDRGRLERRGLGAEPRRHHHRQLKRPGADVGPARDLARVEIWPACGLGRREAPFFCLKRHLFTGFRLIRVARACAASRPPAPARQPRGLR